MKQKITKGKVIQNCLRVTAAVVVAGGVGFQFHEIQELNKDLTTLEQDHKKTVLELKTASENNKTLEQQKKQITAVTEKLSTELDELKESKEAIAKENKKLQEQNQALAEQLREAKEYPRGLSTRSSVKATSVSQSKSSVPPSKSNQSNQSIKTINGVGTAYNANCKGCSGVTASGKKVGNGMIAMADWVPLGTKVRITCPSYPSINGIYTVEDRGGAIKGNKVDIFMTTYSDAIDFGRRDIKIEILN
jgi:3D (Asp-Asp-Asp) domain-containing protein/DNA-binding transcriptional MerR regulator